MTYAIRVENLSKQYRIRHGDIASYRTFRDEIAHAFRRSLLWLRGRTSRQRDDFFALNDVSFDVHSGEVLGVIGRNGAGKSTLLKILSRITKPTRGRVEMRGRVGSLLEVGTGFHPELSGRENIFLSGAILGMKRNEIIRKFDEIVSFAEIEKFVDLPVKRFSSGMYTRLAFSVAAHLQPELLIIDEVLAVGDVDFQKKCMGRMREIATSGNTVLFVSHNLSAVKALCTHALLLEGGRCLQYGASGQVIDEYLAKGTQQGTKVDLTTLDHIGGVREIYLRQVRLLNAMGNRFCVHWKQPIELAFDIEVYEHLRNVHLGAGIRTLDGLAIFTGHANEGRTTRSDSLMPGTYSVTLSIDNDLRPGRYLLHIGANSGSMLAATVFATEAVTLEILDHAEDGGLPLPTDSGLVNAKLSFGCPICTDSLRSKA